jgi:hypothetical protein
MGLSGRNRRRDPRWDFDSGQCWQDRQWRRSRALGIGTGWIGLGVMVPNGRGTGMIMPGGRGTRVMVDGGGIVRMMMRDRPGVGVT